MRAIEEYVELGQAEGIFPEVRVIQGASTNPIVRDADGHEVILFCSSNYLGLAGHPEVKSAVADALEIYGLGANGSRVISGTTDRHVALEAATAQLKGSEAAAAFSTGFMAAEGSIAAFGYVPHFARMCGVPLSTSQSATVISDSLNHASIIDGCHASRAKTAYYNHGDMDMLAEKLKQNRDRRVLVVTDGIFSMDGDIAPLPEILDLARQYGASVMVDDAHATGVLGASGKGTLEHFGLQPAGDILQMGTYSKSFGAIGGFVAASDEVVEYLRWAARPYMFSGSLPPCIVAGIMKAMEIAAREPERRQRLWENRDYLVRHMNALGFDTLGSETPIVPILIGDDETAERISRELYARGIFAPCVKWPAVARGQSRIRVTLMATHERQHLDRLVANLEDLGRAHGVI
ncbi:MAG: aminotransferase class I/II-fold pyridoxal phosphate-dependent enzyme [Thermoleophilia bacterium]